MGPQEILYGVVGLRLAKGGSHVTDLDNPSDEGKHTSGLAVSNSLLFRAQSHSCLTLRASEAMPDSVHVSVCECEALCEVPAR